MRKIIYAACSLICGLHAAEQSTVRNNKFNFDVWQHISTFTGELRPLYLLDKKNHLDFVTALGGLFEQNHWNVSYDQTTKNIVYVTPKIKPYGNYMGIPLSLLAIAINERGGLFSVPSAAKLESMKKTHMLQIMSICFAVDHFCGKSWYGYPFTKEMLKKYDADFGNEYFQGRIIYEEIFGRQTTPMPILTDEKREKLLHYAYVKKWECAQECVAKGLASGCPHTRIEQNHAELNRLAFEENWAPAKNRIYTLLERGLFFIPLNMKDLADKGCSYALIHYGTSSIESEMNIAMKYAREGNKQIRSFLVQKKNMEEIYRLAYEENWEEAKSRIIDILKQYYGNHEIIRLAHLGWIPAQDYISNSEIRKVLLTQEEIEKFAQNGCGKAQKLHSWGISSPDQLKAYANCFKYESLKNPFYTNHYLERYCDIKSSTPNVVIDTLLEIYSENVPN